MVTKWLRTNAFGKSFSLNHCSLLFVLLSGQLNEVRKTSLARIICDNADSVYTAQPLVMRTAGSGNKRVPCSSIPGLDMSLWREEGHHLKIGLLRTQAPDMRGVL